ncbi:MAG: histidine phosphatase family protein [Hyphomicrobiales bacterium]
MPHAIILVRHALPEVTRGLAPSLWPLTEAAREDCVLLAYHLPGHLAPVVLASPERKADETARVIAMRRGLQAELDRNLREVSRPDDWVGDYRDRAAAYLEGNEQPGWEPRDAVVRRIHAALEPHLAKPGDGDLVVVGHGMSLSLYLASLAGIGAVPFWRALTFPDAWRLDLATRELTHLFLTGAPAEG